MTKENSKRLYDHYLEIGRHDASDNLLEKYPEFASDEIAPTEDIEEVKKSE